MKKFRRILWKLFKALAGIFIGNLIAVGILWQIKCGNTPNNSVSPGNKKFLFHMFGIENMSFEDKKNFLLGSPDFMDHYKGEVDSAVTNKILPDQSPAYHVDSTYVLNFHLKNGNPDIKIGYIADFQDYFNPMWGVCLAPFSCLDKKPAKIWINSYFNEMAHAKQFYQNPLDFEFSFLKGAWASVLLAMVSNKTIGEAYREEYDKNGSFEHEAHEKINPVFKDNYLEYRDKYFKNEIKEITEKLGKKKLKYFKDETWTSKKQESEYRLLWATKDSLVYGPLFLRIPD